MNTTKMIFFDRERVRKTMNLRTASCAEKTSLKTRSEVQYEVNRSKKTSVILNFKTMSFADILLIIIVVELSIIIRRIGGLSTQIVYLPQSIENEHARGPRGQ